MKENDINAVVEIATRISVVAKRLKDEWKTEPADAASDLAGLIVYANKLADAANEALVNAVSL